MTCNTEPELTQLQSLRKYLSLYMAIIASEMKEMGDDELAEQLYSASRAYELAMRG